MEGDTGPGPYRVRSAGGLCDRSRRRRNAGSRLNPQHRHVKGGKRSGQGGAPWLEVRAKCGIAKETLRVSKRRASLAVA